MLKIILNRLRPQAEKIIAEEQAGFRAGRSTTEQIFNLRILCKKYLHYQRDLYHAFIDFKKALDRVWHAALWATMKKYNICTNLIQVIKNVDNKTSLSGSNCRSEPVSYAVVEKDCTGGLVMEVFDDSDKVVADVVLVHGSPQSCMPNPAESFLEFKGIN